MAFTRGPVLQGKVAIVTGAGRNIGRAIALAFAREGARLVLNNVSRERNEQVRREVEALGVPAVGVVGSVAEPQLPERLAQAALEAFGRIDILVNNAGITRDALLVRMKDEQWQEVLEVNLTGAFRCCRAVARAMIRQRSGVIINITSVVALIGNVGQANYVASKAGLIGLTRALAKELAPRSIRVNAIAPGFIDAGMTEQLDEATRREMLRLIPLQTFGTPEDVAEVAVFLASDAARYITGQVISVDGGMNL